jgi:hypothetical protein
MARRGPLRNGDVRGHEANQSSTGEAAGLLAQLRMHTDDHVDRVHSQQVDCKGMLNTYNKVDGFTKRSGYSKRTDESGS